MSQQQSLSRQPTDTPAQDWAQVPDRDLKVHMSDSEGTKQAKEAEKSKWEALRKEKQAEAHRQKAEEACLERKTRAGGATGVEWANCGPRVEPHPQAPADPGVQHNDWGPNWDDGGSPHIRGKAAMRQVPTTKKRKKKCSWAMTENNKGTAGGSRRRAGTGGLWGSRKKKGWTGDRDDNNKIEEVPALVVPQFEAAHSCLVRDASELGGSGQGVPERLYDEWMLMVQGRQVVATEWMAAAMELQALTMQAYMRHMTATPLWPPVGWVGAVAGRVEMGARV
ncbi:hypothetical protein F5141DRAFT_1222198 [Pisolithus sp. B1]|nr:hypothetical protein F5141DRAFT_1222198 [Pisolithus sp. B1]